MSELLNAVTSTETITTYDRSYAGQFQNPYGGAPELTFHMHRIAVQDSNGKILSADSLPNVSEAYAPGKVYDLFNPLTGEKIAGQTFTTEQLYAMIYSTMRRGLQDIADAKVAAAAAAAAEAAALAAAAAAAQP